MAHFIELVLNFQPATLVLIFLFLSAVILFIIGLISNLIAAHKAKEKETSYGKDIKTEEKNVYLPKLSVVQNTIIAFEEERDKYDELSPKWMFFDKGLKHYQCVKEEILSQENKMEKEQLLESVRS